MRSARRNPVLRLERSERKGKTRNARFAQSRTWARRMKLEELQPHTYIGLFVSALLLARIAYRFLTVYPSMHAAAQADQNPFAA